MINIYADLLIFSLHCRSFPSGITIHKKQQKLREGYWNFGDSKNTMCIVESNVMTVKNINKARTNITGQEKSMMLIGSSCCRFWILQGRWQSLGQAPQRRPPTQLHPARLGIMSGAQSYSFDPFPFTRLLFFSHSRNVRSKNSGHLHIS